MTETRLCPQCNSPLAENAHFCSNCGWSSDRPVTPAVSAAPPKRSSKVWIWVLGAISLCCICLVLVIAIYFGAKQFGVDIPNPFATKTPTATLTFTPTMTFTPTLTSTSTPTFTPTATLETVETLGVGSWRIREIDSMAEMYVPEGNFIMGSENGDSDESPVHTVWLGSYWIDQTEVSNWQYGLCVDAGACNLPQQTDSVTRSSYFFNPTYQDYPVIWVTWDDAHDYCEWVGGYLPTEAEWEKAARGPNGNIYPWGNSDPTADLANYDNIIGDTTRVDDYLDGASYYGVLNMAGNVYEWVYDYYSATYYSSSPTENPFGPDTGDMFVLKSASFNTDAYLIRSANRGRYAPDTTGDDDGFRCIRYTP